MLLAEEYFPEGMKADEKSRRNLRAIVTLIRPKNIIETGTYLGEGTTLAILQALYDIGEENFNFHTIECNESHYKKAKENIKKAFPMKIVEKNLRTWCGLSIPKYKLPVSIDNDYPHSVFTDYKDDHKYFQEVRSFQMDNCLKAALIEMDYKPDFVVLDSAGHIGTIEFDHIMSLIPSDHSFILYLDDTLHRKHYKTLKKIKEDPRFRVILESESKFGHAVIKFN